MSLADLGVFALAVGAIWLLFKSCDLVVGWADNKIRAAMHADRLARRLRKDETKRGTE
jgi:hypothetical protein